MASTAAERKAKQRQEMLKKGSRVRIFGYQKKV